MSAPFTYGPPADDAEVAAYDRVLFQAFGLAASPGRSPSLEEGLANVRVVRRAGRVVGGLSIQACGQFFGGRPVSTGGIRSVGIAPDARGQGAARFLMEATVRELRGRGTAISTLYPSTRGLYRRSGYEVAGVHPLWRLPLHVDQPAERGVVPRPFDLADAAAMAAIRRLYEGQARRIDGWLDRSDWYWARVFGPRAGDAPGAPLYAYLFEGAEGPEGYVIYTQPAGGPRRYRLKVRDWACATPRARRAMLAFFAQHRTLADQVELHAGPADPLLVMAEEPRMVPTDDHPWMVRVVDVQAALEARGWPLGVGVELPFVVNDPLFPENGRPMVLTVEAGRSAVRLGGDPIVRLDIRGLGALFTGYLAPAAVRSLGLVEGTDAGLAQLRAAFSGPVPWLPEMF